MLMTTTQAAGFMIQRYDLEGAAAMLDQEGLVLLQADALWYIACAADDPVALERLKRIKQPTLHTPFEVLFDSLEMLKHYFPRLHPRFETLLHYHKRPLTVVTEPTDSLPLSVCTPDGRVAVRIVHDLYCRDLIAHLNRPLAVALAHFKGAPWPNHFGRVRSDIIEAVDYVSRYRPKETVEARPTIMVQLDDMDELDFIR
ncbi:MAG: Sua5/YciO/YrdC/YwlC family protein [Saprospiraceae bacterium]